MLRRLIAALTLAVLLQAARAQDETDLLFQDLNGAGWLISNQNGSMSFQADRLPLMVLEGLVNAGMVTQGDPIAGYNDRNYAWVADDIWTYEAVFNVTDAMAKRTNLDLVLEGVDTIAEVYVNDQMVGELNNAHRKYRLPIRESVEAGQNLLSITFYPAAKYARSKSATYPYTVPFNAYPWGLDNFNFIRKPASDFGWDWGPAFAPAGIYRSVAVEAYSQAFLTGASIRQEHQDDGCVDVFFRGVLNAPVAGEEGILTATADDNSWSGSQDVMIEDVGENYAEVKVTIKDNYTLWWPAGFGQQPLYNFTVSYTSDGNNETEGSTSSLARRVGLRTIELVEEPLRDPPGNAFYFRVNGVPIYARGANLIPLHVFHSQYSRKEYERLFGDAVEAHMNMIRIWGGGLYQDDSLFEVADELGILIWQEAMFACAEYPRDEDFLENVKAEITYQAQRIGHHASLAIWGGNNEVETAFAWFPDSRSNPNLFSVDFSKIFVETIRDALLTVDKNIAYVDSSPSNGLFSVDPYVKRWGDAGSASMGDVHFYDYSSNCLDLSSYPRAKFVSEYGYMSYPSFSVYKQYTELKDWSVNSNMSDYRMRHTDGNAQLQTQMQYHFKAIGYNATNTNIQTKLFQQWIYLTQMQQSMCYEAAITQWRRLKSAPDARTMGVLYWQLSDIWAGPSWSGIDYGGHWRLLMYSVRRFFSPVMVSGTYNATQADALSIYITNDDPWEVSGSVQMELIPWAGRPYDQPLATQRQDFAVNALASNVVKTVALNPILANQTLSLNDVVVRLSMTATGDPSELQAQTCTKDEDDPFTSICTPAQGIPPQEADPEDRAYKSSQVMWLSEPKAAAIPLNPQIRVSGFKQVDNKTVSFQISSRLVAANVQLDSEDLQGIFSDNGFLLLPWEGQTITFRGREDIKASDLQNSLTILSLADTLTGGVVSAF